MTAQWARQDYFLVRPEGLQALSVEHVLALRELERLLTFLVFLQAYTTRVLVAPRFVDLEHASCLRNDLFDVLRLSNNLCASFFKAARHQ